MGIKHATTADGTVINDPTRWAENHVIDGTVTPDTDDSYDLGSSSAEFKDLYIDGTAYLDAVESGSQTRGSVFVWKDVSENALNLLNQAADVSWTDLDLTATTSANAKMALLAIRINVDTAAKMYNVGVRKNGTTPTYYPQVELPLSESDASDLLYAQLIVGMDTGQVIEYAVTMTAGGQCDVRIDVLGYWE